MTDVNGLITFAQNRMGPVPASKRKETSMTTTVQSNGTKKQPPHPTGAPSVLWRRLSSFFLFYGLIEMAVIAPVFRDIRLAYVGVIALCLALVFAGIHLIARDQRCRYRHQPSEERLILSSD